MAVARSSRTAPCPVVVMSSERRSASRWCWFARSSAITASTSTRKRSRSPRRSASTRSSSRSARAIVPPPQSLAPSVSKPTVDSRESTEPRRHPSLTLAPPQPAPRKGRVLAGQRACEGRSGLYEWCRRPAAMMVHPRRSRLMAVWQGESVRLLCRLYFESRRMSSMPKKIDPELKARAVRLVHEHRGGVPVADRRGGGGGQAARRGQGVGAPLGGPGRGRRRCSARARPARSWPRSRR